MRQAETLYRGILLVQADHHAALHMLGYLRFQQGRSVEALRWISKSLEVEPRNAGAWSNIGLVQANLGRLDQALASYEKALALKPDHVGALYNRGGALLDLKRPEEALKSYDRALSVKPDYVEALINRGNAQRELGRREEALTSYDRALALRPDFFGALINRANALEELGRHEEALESYDNALALNPNSPPALLNRGNVLKALNRLEEALHSYDRALALHPKYAEAYGNKALLLTELGRFDQASAAIAKTVELAPEKVASCFSRLSPRKSGREDPYVRAMEARARQMPSLSQDEQIDLHFALGKAYAEMDAHELSFQHLLAGNALKRKQTNYDEASALGNLERMRTAFSRRVLRAKEGAGDASDVPVFVLGMPRSGTTLVEHILATHPKVFGAGETDDFDKSIVTLDAANANRFDCLGGLSHISGEQLRQLGSRYVGRIRRHAPTADRVINKTPANFRLTALIHLALPNARIIHVRRDPADTCLSCFSKRFTGDLPYTYDLAELGRYYRAYETLMAHWRDVLPVGRMLEVRYEDLVGDLEGESRRIIAYCRLEWDPRCLDFHETERLVQTASAIQVRRPVYRSSVGRWRAFERHLSPLLAELGRQG